MPTYRIIEEVHSLVEAESPEAAIKKFLDGDSGQYFDSVQERQVFDEGGDKAYDVDSDGND